MKYYEKNATTCVLYFFGVISQWYNGAQDFANTFLDIQRKYQNVDILVHCYGGDVLEGTAIYNTIKQSTLNVTWDIIGTCASMMTIVILSKGKIRMCANAYVLIHAPSGGAYGNAKDMFANGKALKNMEENFLNNYSKKIGKKPADVAYLMDGADHWFTAEECFEMKYVDEVIDAVDDDADINGKPDAGTKPETVYNRYAAVATLFPATFNNAQNNTMDKNVIIASFGLTGVTAASSDTAIIESLVAHVKGKDTQIASLTAEMAAFKTAGIDAAIAARETAMNAKFSPEQISAFKTVGGVSMAAMQTLLDGYKPLPKVASMLEQEERTDGRPKTEQQKKMEARADWDFKKWQKEDPEGLEALANSSNTEDYALFAKLYKAEFKVAPHKV